MDHCERCERMVPLTYHANGPIEGKVWRMVCGPCVKELERIREVAQHLEAT